MPTALSKPNTRIAKPANGKPATPASVHPVVKTSPACTAAPRKSDRPVRSKGRIKVVERVPAESVQRAGILWESTKGTAILSMLQRKDGATIVEMVAATGWQAHSVRGFLSGALRKKHGFAIASDRDASGARRYRIAR